MQEDNEFDYKSKSQVKRELLEITVIAEQLILLTEIQIKKIPLADHILAQVVKGRKLSKIARKRHIQYVSKLLRNEDNLSEIIGAFEKIRK
ncbi:hypothetical protein PsalMR5_03895 [Piscirickettsia salmonis]|uniref:dual-action ribosomal maturation protein DarP n=1 Tax=Piscirickettsia salmonis TaxID=1238 RepID=UPI0012BA69CE|nr:DUF615 domain-containing protein [Piscirickettsia salmonis]QGP56412.1 hypothetical protein PsalSR1_03896 [Piscirickettsia salmonis]QGP57723.1 hypothetical protein PsalBI1_00261 [Piscirickettsia salmonis]QGP65975.1 hypothetical protein PsalMR5_03895 [Piscirickettsia salmonis]